jgi:hypothetical protein
MSYEGRLYRDVVDEIRQALTARNGANLPSATAIAWALGLRPRTLNRVLGKPGTGFNRLLGEARFESAQ